MTRKTIATSVSATGTALHAGNRTTMRLRPAEPGSGIVFRCGGTDIPARWENVTETRLGTVLSKDGASVAVVEHVMSAIRGAGLDDLLVEIDGPEPPILSGDAQGYLELIDKAGIVEQDGLNYAIKVLRTVEVAHGDARARLQPADSFSLSFEIEFPSRIVGRQTYDFAFSADAFRNEIAPARTFGFLHEHEALLKAGLARGASLENTLTIDGDGLMNADLLRFKDEFVRHKILDAVGDLALAGAPLLARFEGFKSGHGLNNALLRALFADPANTDRVVLA